MIDLVWKDIEGEKMEIDQVVPLEPQVLLPHRLFVSYKKRKYVESV